MRFQLAPPASRVLLLHIFDSFSSIASVRLSTSTWPHKPQTQAAAAPGPKQQLLLLRLQADAAQPGGPGPTGMQAGQPAQALQQRPSQTAAIRQCSCWFTLPVCVWGRSCVCINCKQQRRIRWSRVSGLEHDAWLINSSLTVSPQLQCKCVHACVHVRMHTVCVCSLLYKQHTHTFHAKHVPEQAHAYCSGK